METEAQEVLMRGLGCWASCGWSWGVGGGGASAADPPGSAPSLEFREQSGLSPTRPSPIPPLSGLTWGSSLPSLPYQQLCAGPSDVGCCPALAKEHVSVVQVQTPRAAEGGEVKTAVGGKLQGSPSSSSPRTDPGACPEGQILQDEV